MQKLKSFLLLGASIVLVSCISKYDGFVLHGIYTGSESLTLYIIYTDSTGNNVTDSTEVKSGKFEFKGAIKEPSMVQLWKGDPRKRDEKNVARFFVDPTTMQLTLDEADLSKYVLSGSQTNELSVNLDAQKKELYEQMGELRKKSLASTDDAEKEAIDEQLNEVSGKVQAVNTQFMKNHPNSILSAYNLRYVLSSLSYPEAIEIYNSFTLTVQNSYWGKQTVAEIERKGRGEPGKKARLFVKNDIDGKELNLFELNKEHYLLIDFWASWCVPCRKGNPHLKEIHKKYAPKGLLIVCIGDNDATPDEWVKAIEKDNIGEFRHVLRGLKRTDNGFDRSEDLSENFGNSVLPTKYLIDKTGTIILKCTSDTEELDAKLKEIFGS